MKGFGAACLMLSLAAFLVFFTNVGLGAARAGVFLGDVAEMLTLFAAAILFVIGVLAREADEKNHQGRTGK